MANAKAVVIRRDGVAVGVVNGDPMPWFHFHCAAYSMSHAITHEGYSVDEVEPWGPDKAREERSRTRHYFYGDSWHNSGGCIREGRLGRENCAQCCLRGYEPPGGFEPGYEVTRDGPNVAGWARDYVASGTVIPAKWYQAFLMQLNSDNTAYVAALTRDLATFGVTFKE